MTSIYNRPDTNGDNNFMHKMESWEASGNLEMRIEIWRTDRSPFLDSRIDKGQ